WPMRVIPKQFRATGKQKISDEVDRGGYGLFTFDALDVPRIDFVKRLVQSAEKMVGRIDGIVLPELALTPKSAQRMSRAFVRDDRFFITGIGNSAGEGQRGDNYI